MKGPGGEKLGDGMAAGGGGGVAGKAVWEQRKWEKQDGLEAWAREGSPATAGLEAGWRAGGRGGERCKARQVSHGEAALWGWRPTDSGLRGPSSCSLSI